MVKNRIDFEKHLPLSKASGQGGGGGAINPLLETTAIILAAGIAIYLAHTLSKRPGTLWIIAYSCGLSLIALLVAARCCNCLKFTQPFSWLVTGRAKIIVLCMGVTLGLTSPLSRLRNRFEKAAVCTLMTVVLVWFCVLPFLYPALTCSKLSTLDNNLDSDGICRQTTDYTCGPAAAVTALQTLGLHAREGQLAVLSHSSPVLGTLPRCLCKAIKARYPREIINCSYQRFNSIDELKNNLPALAVLKRRVFWDHCVAVLEVSDKSVVFADPVEGKKRILTAEFEQMWRFTAISIYPSRPAGS